MAKRGRKTFGTNIVALDVSKSRPRLSPPSSLNAAERPLFVELVTANPHLDAADIPFVADLAQAMVKARKLARKTDAQSIRSWEMTSRVVLSMATKLRVTAQATTHPEKAGRARANATTEVPPWVRQDEIEPPYSRDEIGDDDELE